MTKKYTNLYSYAGSWKNSIHSKTLWKTIRRTYLFKTVLLALVLPMDLVIGVYIIVSGKRFNLFFATEKWPDFTEVSASRASTASILPPTHIIHYSKSKYFPASIFYVPAAIGLFLPSALHNRWSSVVVMLTSSILKRLASTSATLVVHSDALPFGRALVVAANKIRIKTVCIQHGSFRESNIIDEQDGFLCDLNIVRSLEDSEIIRKASRQTDIHVIPDFFKIRLNQNREKKLRPRVILLGEGYHILDKDFNRVYLDYLVILQNELLERGVDVDFRPHPSERKMRWGNLFKSIDRGLLQESLSQANAVVGYSSTLLQECAEIGIPSFYVEPNGEERKIDNRNGVSIIKLIQVDYLISCAQMNHSQVENILENSKVDRANLDILELLLK